MSMWPPGTLRALDLLDPHAPPLVRVRLTWARVQASCQMLRCPSFPALFPQTLLASLPASSPHYCSSAAPIGPPWASPWRIQIWIEGLRHKSQKWSGAGPRDHAKTPGALQRSQRGSPEYPHAAECLPETAKVEVHQTGKAFLCEALKYLYLFPVFCKTCFKHK